MVQREIDCNVWDKLCDRFQVEMRTLRFALASHARPTLPVSARARVVSINATKLISYRLDLFGEKKCAELCGRPSSSHGPGQKRSRAKERHSIIPK